MSKFSGDDGSYGATKIGDKKVNPPKANQKVEQEKAVEEPKKPSIFARAFNAIKEKIQEKIIEPIKNVVNTVKEKINNAVNTVKEKIQEKIIDPIKNAVNTVKEKIQEKIIDPIKNVVNTVKEKIQEKIVDPIKNAVNTVKEKVANVVQTIKDKLPNFKKEPKAQTMSKTNDSISKPAYNAQKSIEKASKVLGEDLKLVPKGAVVKENSKAKLSSYEAEFGEKPTIGRKDIKNLRENLANPKTVPVQKTEKPKGPPQINTHKHKPNQGMGGR